MNPLLNHVMAFDYLKRFFRSKYGGVWFTPIPKNKGRHILLVSQESSPKMLYCLFKKEWLRCFNNLFPSFIRAYKGFYSGLGESINVEWLNYAISVGVNYLCYVYPDRKVYVVSPLAVKKFCEKNGLIRKQDRINSYLLADCSKSRELVNESTYVFPIKLLERLDADKLINISGGIDELSLPKPKKDDREIEYVILKRFETGLRGL